MERTGSRASIGDAVDGAYAHAVRSYRAGHLPKAKRFCGDVLRRDPDHLDAVLLLGVIAAQSGRLDDAKAAFEKAKKIDPESARAVSYLGNVLRECGDLEPAMNAYERAIALDPKSAVTYLNLGNVYVDLKRVDDAISSYRNAVRLAPSYVGALNNLGNTYCLVDNLDGAIDCYRKALQADPNNDESHNNLANALVIRGRIDEAIECLRRAIACNPRNAKSHNNLGNILIEQGKPKEALFFYRRAVEIDPDYTEAAFMVANLSGETPETAPKEYVEALFDDYARWFESHLVEKLQYKVPLLLRQRFDDILEPERCLENVIDIGCGTGMMGAAFKPRARRLNGVDVSANMIEEARRKNIYDQLSHTDILDFLKDTDERFDLFLAGDVFIYIGNLTPIFAAIRARATPAAYFLFSIESVTDEAFKLKENGRYGQSRAYVEHLSSENGFAVRLCEETIIRRNQAFDDVGYLFVLQCTGPG